MNKILVGKNKITSDSENIQINGNILVFNNDGDYILEYLDDNCYHLEFVIKGNIKLTEVSFDREIKVDNRYIVQNGYLKLFKFYNNKNVLEKIDIDLFNEGDKVDYHFANICKMDEKYTININHKCKNTRSNIVNRSVALKNSVLKFVINSNVDNDSVKSILDQNTRIVTMDECDASISPNMFIDLDDVEARHGSVIGSFNDDQVFYLMSKGISYNDTLKLLIKGYILGGLEIDFETRQRIIEIIETYWR